MPEPLYLDDDAYGRLQEAVDNPAPATEALKELMSDEESED